MSHCKNKNEIPKRLKCKRKMKTLLLHTVLLFPCPMGLELLKFEMCESRVRGLRFSLERGKWTGKEPAPSAAVL